MKKRIKAILSMVWLVLFGWFFRSLYHIDILFIGLSFVLRYVFFSLVHYSYIEHRGYRFFHLVYIWAILFLSIIRFTLTGFSFAAILMPLLTLLLYYTLFTSKKNFHTAVVWSGSRWYIAAGSTTIIVIITFLFSTIVVSRIETIQPNCDVITKNIWNRQTDDTNTSYNFDKLFADFDAVFSNGATINETFNSYKDDFLSQIWQQRTLITLQICENISGLIQTNIKKPQIQLAILISLGIILWPIVWILFWVIRIFAWLVLFIAKKFGLYEKKIITKEIEIRE